MGLQRQLSPALRCQTSVSFSSMANVSDNAGTAEITKSNETEIEKAGKGKC